MSWNDEKNCPLCGSTEFLPVCDEVDIGVGVQEGNLGGTCGSCGDVAQCRDCLEFVSSNGPSRCRCRVVLDAHFEVDLGADGELRGVSICPGFDPDRPMYRVKR